MRPPVSLLDADRPPPPGPSWIPRGDVASPILEDLTGRGVAVLQGPAGSGTSTLAAAVAELWPGPVVWKRAGLFWHLADLARPLWDEAPDALQQAPADDVVDAILRRLVEAGILWVLDDFDDALDPPPGPAVPRDPDVAALFAAIEAGALAASGAAVLVVTRRSPRGLSAPPRPIPPLPVEAATALAERPLDGLDAAWCRRPGALALLPALPRDVPPPSGGIHPFDELLDAIAESLDETTATVLLTAAMAVHPVGVVALHSATGLPREDVARAVATLTNLRLLVPRGAGRLCPRHVAEAAVTVLPDRLPNVLAEPTLGRLAAFYVRQGSGTGRGWRSADPAITARFGGRLGARAGYPALSLTTALYAGHVAVLERFGALRALRDDLGAALARPGDGIPPLDEARARLARARAAARLQDHAVVDAELPRALGPARAAHDADLVREIQGLLGRRLLLAEDPTRAVPHLQEALVLARSAGARGEEAGLLLSLAGVALREDDTALAERRFTQAKVAAEEADSPRLRAAADAGRAGVVLHRGRLREAEELMVDAADAAAAIEDAGGEASRRANVAIIRTQRGDLRGAMKAVRQGLAAGADDPRSRARLLTLRAELRRLAGDLEGARADLDRAEPFAAGGGDRALVADLTSVRADLAALDERWDDSVEAWIAASRALGRAVDPAGRAALELRGRNAEAWRGAAGVLDGERHAVDVVLEASRRANELLAVVLESPLRPRRVAAELQAHEAALLAATVAGTAPMGTLRRLDVLLAAASDDPERSDTGEPAIRLALAWAQRLCRQEEVSRATATEAARRAGLASMATARGRALALAGREAQPWNAPARLLAAFFPPRGD